MRLLIVSLLALALLPAAAHAQEPVATTGTANPVGATTATLTGTVDPNATPTTYFFEYGTTTAYGLRTPAQSAGSADGEVPVQATISGLTPNTAYHFRLVANDVAGEDRTFTTSAQASNPSAPSISSLAARDKTATSARLTARITPNRATTTYYVEWGTTSNLGNRTPDQILPANTGGGVTVSVPLDGLPAYTKIHWRVVASNAAGVRRSGRASFTTLRTLSGVSLDLFPATAAWGGEVTLSGQVQGGGVNSLPVALEQSSFPFEAGFHQVATARTGRSGTFRFSGVRAYIATSYRVVVRTNSSGSVTSSEVRARVRPRVRLHRSTKTRRKQRLAGRINPGLPNGRVTLQRRTRSGHWAYAGRKRVATPSTTASTYAFTVRRQRRAVAYRVRIDPRDGGAYVSNWSNSTVVAAKPRKRR